MASPPRAAEMKMIVTCSCLLNKQAGHFDWRRERVRKVIPGNKRWKDSGYGRMGRFTYQTLSSFVPMLSIPHSGSVDIAILLPDKKIEAQRSGATKVTQLTSTGAMIQTISSWLHTQCLSHHNDHSLWVRAETPGGLQCWPKRMTFPL